VATLLVLKTRYIAFCDPAVRNARFLMTLEDCIFRGATFLENLAVSVVEK